MTASVTIITDQVDNALLVPNKAIRTSSGQKYVTVMFEGQQISVPVTIGLTGSSMTEVISDQLREGDVVVLAGTTASTTSANSERGTFIIEGGEMPGGGMPPGGMP
jgi:HlyD family secretion protein